MPTICIGGGATAYKGIQSIAVSARMRDSVTITNLDGDPVAVLKGINDPAPAMLNSGSSVTVTTPTWLASQGRSTVQLTGGQYGAV